ncbi:MULTISPECIES: GNAT family N-acetyltransferase [Acinetobacter]|uniref:GNAT family N-acetyltransferase n=1 Tax=Acinetobacter TaxID=469 RepID=UPI0002AEB3D5|nr:MULTISPECIES: GNAT family protein [Acinetobacter]ELW78382.1 acetyltransferase (GNAT) domain protein [Acinetobacter sp. WC-743]KKW78299.1 amino acid acetyltransferase [Acinetobacter sp. Ag2]MBJ8425183.1 GNAT family N-acetyltransferase [Acinetobacter bereziniae]MBJ8476656.1 GNAT family N-acetyltransferase [Acinetobacter bereziniae]
MTWLTSQVLENDHVILKPLEIQHMEALIEAVCDGELWNLWFTHIPTPEQMRAEIQRRLNLQTQGKMLPYTVIEKQTAQVLGMTSFMNIEAVHRRVEIGSTWYRQSVQRTHINTACKQLLLSYAFDHLDCIAVEFRTSSFNFKSRAAIERLGAKLDGILRSHQIVKDDILRDTYVYSILKSEWAAVRQHLNFLLDKSNNSKSI